MDSKTYYGKLLGPLRLVERKPTKAVPSIDEYTSDRSRILYSSYFRALQQKTQVFPLEMNRTVRTRLVHCLEVSDIGRILALKVSTKLLDKHYLDVESAAVIPTIVENACLMHDIGNPPFGHFGETAIKEWFFCHCDEYAQASGIDLTRNNLSYKRYIVMKHDLTEFDGNQQGIRTAIRLRPGSIGYPMNLTYQTLLSTIKYPASTSEYEMRKLKKAGYFETEHKIVDKMVKAIGLKDQIRFPLSYITEAADDLAYCMSDIDDGLEKKLITATEFVESFRKIWQNNYPRKPIPVTLPRTSDGYSFALEISAKWTKYLIEEVARSYIEKHDSIISGELPELIFEDSDAGRVLKTIKTISRSSLYTAHEVISLELAGLKAISGLLDHFCRLLLLSKDQFGYLVCKSKNSTRKGFDVEWRIFNRIARRFVATYKNCVMDTVSHRIKEENFEVCFSRIDAVDEWFYRAHMIIDHITSMTDDYAISQFETVSGMLHI